MGDVPVLTSCPDALLLQDFLLGRVNAAALDELAAHVEQCRTCQCQLQQEGLSDPLLQALGTSPPEFGLQGDQLTSLMERLYQLNHHEERRGCLAPLEGAPSVLDPNATFPSSADGASAPVQVPGYEILGELGRGG